MTKARYIYDQIAVIATDVATKTGISLYYQYGDPKEIITNLKAMTIDPEQTNQKYPMLALFTDIEEKRGEQSSIEARVELNMILATLTQPTLIAPERMELNFKTTLYPLYYQLLKSISASGYFTENAWQRLSHQKIDRLYWGRHGLITDNGNVFGDYIDAIEITNLKLSIKTQC